LNSTVIILNAIRYYFVVIVALFYGNKKGCLASGRVQGRRSRRVWGIDGHGGGQRGRVR